MTRLRWLVAIPLLAVACGEEPPVVQPVLVGLVITASDTATAPNHTVTLTATGVDSDGGVVDLTGIAGVEWSVADTMRGRISPGGAFTAGPWVGRVWVYGRVVDPPLADSVQVHVVPPGTVRWRWSAADAGGHLPTIGGVALGLDGAVYVLVELFGVPNHANLVALDPLGRLRWAVELRGVAANYPVVTPGGEILVVGQRLHLVRPDGTVAWEILTDASAGAIFLSGAATADVAIAATGEHVGAWGLPSGDSLWQSPLAVLGDWVVPPTIVGSSHVYAKHSDDSLFVFRLSDGTILKTFPDPDTGVDTRVFGVGTVPIGERFYLPTWSRLAAYDTAGPLLWQTGGHGRGTPEPAVSSDGTLYGQSRRWGLDAITSDGGTRWYRRRFIPPNGPSSEEPRWPWYGGAALAQGGVVYGAGFDRFFAYDTEGALLWEYMADSAGVPQAFVGAPAIGADGIVYTFTDTHVYAFWASAPPEPNSPWPMWRHDAQRTGWAQ